MSPPEATPLPLDDVARAERVLDAPRDEVWAALAAPDGLEGWLADRAELPLEAGAEGTVVVDGEPRDAAVDEVDPGRRLALRWATGTDDEAVVDVVLDDAPGGATRVTVVETPLRVLRAVGLPSDAGALRGGPAGGRPMALARR